MKIKMICMLAVFGAERYFYGGSYVCDYNYKKLLIIKKERKGSKVSKLIDSCYRFSHEFNIKRIQIDLQLNSDKCP